MRELVIIYLTKLYDRSPTEDEIMDFANGSGLLIIMGEV